MTGKIYGNFIGGKWWEANETFPVYHKFTNEVIARVAKASREEVGAAVEHAVSAVRTKALAPYERYEILMKSAEWFRRQKEEIASTIVQECGKVLKDARQEVDRCIQTFIASAEEAKRIGGSEIPIQGQPGNNSKLAFTIRVPVGVICAITPFNFPLNLVAHKVAPAIAAGNAVVLKPAGYTPLSSFRMAEILAEAGLPDGYLNIVNGSGQEIGKYLLEDKRINMYTFTGSPSVGKQIKNSTGIRKVTLELGNNSPNIVHKDAPDLEKAVRLCVSRGFTNNGQACISVQRIYVHRDIYDEFVAKAVTFAGGLAVGDPEQEETDVGPMIAEKEAARVEEWITEAVSQGARVVFGGKRTGALLQPTILTDVTPEMKVVCQEVFAPLVSIVPYDSIDEAIEAANDSDFGLQAGLFTSNLQLALSAAKRLEFGGVIINDSSSFRADIMPYGGVKDSGIGREGPSYAVQEMTEERIVVIEL
ncbi:aldehyde dehydrogenase family protein [Paenibacillus thalictri]|uniref:3-sulfolactaldehyde dehydrogenase n=1 Tax=Paenibacillus thalictri TaxID=2527873 RepID=A0A4Q9DPF8_9BACL|nr:aldehyde dehydrogenase family protein [Paenibacillus thalictri]TBL75670.1 aldehyde dehydrogenase family protein [Paenibacillus thalictri]